MTDEKNKYKEYGITTEAAGVRMDFATVAYGGLRSSNNADTHTRLLEMFTGVVPDVCDVVCYNGIYGGDALNRVYGVTTPYDTWYLFSVNSHGQRKLIQGRRVVPGKTPKQWGTWSDSCTRNTSLSSKCLDVFGRDKCVYAKYGVILCGDDEVLVPYRTYSGWVVDCDLADTLDVTPLYKIEKRIKTNV